MPLESVCENRNNFLWGFNAFWNSEVVQFQSRSLYWVIAVELAVDTRCCFDLKVRTFLVYVFQSFIKTCIIQNCFNVYTQWLRKLCFRRSPFTVNTRGSDDNCGRNSIVSSWSDAAVPLLQRWACFVSDLMSFNVRETWTAILERMARSLKMSSPLFLKKNFLDKE